MAEPPVGKRLIDIIKKCRQKKNLPHARQLHAYLRNHRLDSHSVFGNYLVPLLVDCGALPDAHRAFDCLVSRHERSWTSLISGYMECGESQQAFQLYYQMQADCVNPSTYTLVALLKGCTNGPKHTEIGHHIHADIIMMGLEGDPFVGNTLVGMYGKCGVLDDAHHVLHKLPVRDIVSWNALIAGLAEHRLVDRAFRCLVEMQLEEISPDDLTFVCCLKACAIVGALGQGQLLHAKIAERGLENSIIIGSTVVDMYAKCGSLIEAYKAFAMLPVRNSVSWNALILGYAELGLGDRALSCFKQMQLEGVSPDDITYPCSLKACGIVKSLETGQDLHTEIIKRGLDKDFFVLNTTIDMYGKCSAHAEAQKLFDQMPVRGSFSWTALISAYAEHGLAEEAMKCFQRMRLESVLLSPVAFACSIKACGIIGALEIGQELHSEIVMRGLETDSFVGNTLLDMYGKCGWLLEGQKTFAKMLTRDVISWTAMISAYGENHESNMAVQCFMDMQEQGVKPNATTFLCLLGACSHASLVLEGQDYFKVMTEEHRIHPTADHYACMVDLLARSGHLYEAERYVEAMQCLPSDDVLRTLLSACKIHGDVELALRCFQQLVLLNQDDASVYLIMADIYASAGIWVDADRMQNMRMTSGAKKKPANAVIELNRKCHEFVIGAIPVRDISPMLETLIENLNSHVKLEGNIPNLDLVLMQDSNQ